MDLYAHIKEKKITFQVEIVESTNLDDHIDYCSDHNEKIHSSPELLFYDECGLICTYVIFRQAKL